MHYNKQRSATRQRVLQGIHGKAWDSTTVVYLLKRDRKFVKILNSQVSHEICVQCSNMDGVSHLSSQRYTSNRQILASPHGFLLATSRYSVNVYFLLTTSRQGFNVHQVTVLHLQRAGVVSKISLSELLAFVTSRFSVDVNVVCNEQTQCPCIVFNVHQVTVGTCNEQVLFLEYH